MKDTTEWPHDDCECGSTLHYIQAEELPEGHIYEDTEMTCSDELCSLISQVSFNDDGSTYSTSCKKGE